MSRIYNYTKANQSNNIVQANPGTHITDTFAPYADLWVTTEIDYSNYINPAVYFPATSNFELNPANSNRIMHIVTGVDAAEFANAHPLTQSRNAGWVYITDQTAGAKYGQLPSYFDPLLLSVTADSSAALPSRSVQAAPTDCNDPYALQEDVDDENTPVAGGGASNETPTPRSTQTPATTIRATSEGITAPQSTSLRAPNSGYQKSSYYAPIAIVALIGASLLLFFVTYRKNGTILRR